jgi:quercetin dioxygenase-like cupin family protein
MKKLLIVIGVMGAMGLAASGTFAKGKAETGKSKEVIYASSETATYTGKVPGVTMAVLWGDPDKGRHGAFTKFAPGQDNGMHTHTNDVWCMVIKGAYLYKDDAGEKRVGPGEFIFIPGGHKHWSGGDKTEGALFYEEGAGKFDLLPVK